MSTTNKTENTHSEYTHRLLARFIIEAKTPLAVGTGQKDILTDAVVALDVNGLPYIPGTSLAGVLRSMIDPKKESKLFGYQKKTGAVKKDEVTGRGSEIIVSEARILDSKMKVLDGLHIQSELKKDALLCHYLRPMPVRQHVRISHKGVAEDGGKFDQQVVYAGTRFCFEVEIISEDDDTKNLNDVIANLRHQSFRIGGGVHNGFGRIEVVEAKTAVLNLQKPEDLEAYVSKSSSLADGTFWNGRNEDVNDSKADKGYIHYELQLQPDDFFMFGSGFGDENGDADMTTVKAAKVVWKSGTGKLEVGKVLIPATSVKGALRHRVAYHYNKLNHLYVNNGATEADENPAVAGIFGKAEGNSLKPGHILLEDIIDEPAKSKLVNHVSIDRFTGGAIDGALFTEQVDYAKERTFKFDVYVEEPALPEEDHVREAFEKALTDICQGMLPLGGGVNRGNGIFHGNLLKDGKLIYEYK